MIFFIFTREQRLPNVELVEDTAERPHVDGGWVGNTEHDLRCSIEATLDVGVDLLVLEATWTEVNDFNSWFVNLAEEDVLRFQVTVHDVVLSHVVKRDEDLDSKPLDQAQWEAQEVVHLDEVVQVDTKEFEGDVKMLAEDKVITLLYNIFLILRVVSIQSID